MAYETRMIVKVVVVDGPNSSGDAQGKLKQLMAARDPSKAKQVLLYEYKKKVTLKDLPPINYVLNLGDEFKFAVTGARLRIEEDGEVSMGEGGKLELIAEYIFSSEDVEAREKEILDKGFKRMGR